MGGGTAGCVGAARLVARGCSVTLLEAGGAYSRILDVPLVGLWVWLRRPQRYCWDHWTVPQSSLGGRSVWFPAGRIVGGSSAINAMIYCRGDRRSYDRWEGIGAEFLPADRSLAEHIEAHASSSFHPVGTCRMGTDEMAVVDRELRVRGVDGLRVVDASIMPTTVSGNAQAAVFAIAERATDLISPLGA